MRKILRVGLTLLVLTLLLSGVSLAGSKTINFAWEQGTSDLPNLQEWRIHSSLTQGGPYKLLSTIPFDGTTKLEYTGSGTVTEIADGQKATVYFVATAFGKSGAESGYSNEVSALIDFTTVTTPINLKIVITN